MLRAIRKIERELQKAGVPCHYKNRLLRNGAEVRPDEEPSLPPTPGPSFEVGYSHGHMSNGESVLSPLMFVHTKAGKRPEVYGSLDFEKGLKRIKALFGVHSTVPGLA
jgi:hypothetical protein